MTETPRCEVSQTQPETEFVFVHDCKTWMPPDEEHDDRFLVDKPGDRRSLPLETPGQSGWVWVGEPGRTLHPSIDCRRCGTHGFWINNEWRPAR